MSDEDRLLAELGGVGRARRDTDHVEPVDDGPLSDPSLLAYMQGRLPPAQEQALEAALASDPTATHRLALLMRGAAPLAADVEARVVAEAQAMLRPAAASFGDRLRAWLAGLAAPVPAGGLALALALLLLWAWPRQSPTPDPALPQYALTLSGQHQRWQGSHDPGTDTRPEFGPSSELRALLKPEVEGSPAALSAFAEIKAAQQTRWVRLTPDGPAQVAAGPGGLLLTGAGATLFGDEPAEVELWLAVSAPNLPVVSLGGGGPEQRAALLEAAAAGRLRLVRAQLTYTPTP